jgi:hypothetical protein
MKRPMMTPAEAVVLLRNHLITKDALKEYVEPFGVLIDHIMQLEQALELIKDGVTSALRNKPANAILNVNVRKRDLHDSK